MSDTMPRGPKTPDVSEPGTYKPEDNSDGVHDEIDPKKTDPQE